jgi:tRNA 2-thiouridine synthesizing protein A
MMRTTVDARGLSCPQPVLMTMDEMKKVGQGEITIMVDTETSRENVSRAAESRGWQVREVQEEGEGFRLTIEKG